MARPELTLVIPIYNEEEVLPQLDVRLKALLERLGENVAGVEVVFVNDGSRDRSIELLRLMAEAEPRYRVIGFSRNFGHQRAITAGMDKSRGEAVVVMDADLQDPPEVIVEMVARWRAGYDVVYGRRRSRGGESFFKLVTAKLFYRLFAAMIPIEVPLDTGDFRLMSRRVVMTMRALRETHRFVRGLVAWVGFKQTAVEYDRQARAAGTTKYPFRKMLAFAIDGIASFSILPLRVASYLGVVVAVVSIVCGILALFSHYAGMTIPGWTTTVVLMSFLFSVQFMVMGVLGEYVGRIYEQVKSRPLYVIAEQINIGRSQSRSRRGGRARPDEQRDRKVGMDAPAREVPEVGQPAPAPLAPPFAPRQATPPTPPTPPTSRAPGTLPPKPSVPPPLPAALPPPAPTPTGTGWSSPPAMGSSALTKKPSRAPPVVPGAGKSQPPKLSSSVANIHVAPVAKPAPSAPPPRVAPSQAPPRVTPSGSPPRVAPSQAPPRVTPSQAPPRVTPSSVSPPRVTPSAPPVGAIQRTPSAPRVGVAPKVPSVPPTAAAPKVPSVPAMASAPKVPSVPPASAAPKVPSVPAMASAPKAPSVPPAPAAPRTPSAPRVAVAPKVLSVPSTPAAPPVPPTPAAPPMPHTPSAPIVAALAKTPSVASIPVAPKKPSSRAMKAAAPLGARELFGEPNDGDGPVSRPPLPLNPKIAPAGARASEATKAPDPADTSDADSTRQLPASTEKRD